VTITIYGQQSQVAFYIGGGLLLLLGMVLFIRWKRPVYYDVAGGKPINPSRFRVGEDISLQPKASKQGHRFLGWSMDEDHQHPFEGMRMPMKAVRLYAKFKKTKTNR
jgi:LPXTG-motif cell wall-anchored protein